MGILDEAIREHLELKRRHGAEQGELRQLEDEAFGPPARPEAESEAPEAALTEAGVLEAGTVEHEVEAGVLEAEVAAQEAEAGVPEAESAPPEASGSTPPAGREASSEEAQAAAAPQDPEGIAQQPTEIFDVAGELAREKAEEAEQAADDDEEPSGEAASAEPPAEEAGSEVAEIAEQEAAELETVEPEVVEPEPAQPEATEPEPQAEIFDERSLSEELDQALEGPVDAEQRRAAFFEETDEFGTPTQRPSRQTREESPDTSEEDVLEETPDFLEETPEHDRLWFEQKPPKDFDFND